MSDLANLPYDTTPADFFSMIQAELAGEAAPANAGPEKLAIHIAGDGGGQWAIGFVDGTLKVEATTADAPPLQVSMSVGDWREMVCGRVRDAVAAKHDTGGGLDANAISKLSAVAAEKTDQIKAFDGDLQLVIEDAEKSAEHRVTLTFGGGAPNTATPMTTVTTTLDDFISLTTGELQPQAAFFAGKIRLDGDMNLAMSLMALAMG